MNSVTARGRRRRCRPAKLNWMLHAKDILEAALQLDPSERASLVEELSASLHGLELGAEWEAEIARRIQEVDAGRVETVPGEAVFTRLGRRFGAA
jgi:putative addiction module component (TIGR02574 family)